MAEVLGTDTQYSIEQLDGELGYNDQLVLAGIFKLCYPGEGSVPLDEFKEALEPHVDESEKRAVLLGMRDRSTESLVGFGILSLVQHPSDPRVEVDYMGIHPRLRKQGLGSAFVREITTFTDQQGIPVVQFSDVPKYVVDRVTKKPMRNPALGMLSKEGFEQIARNKIRYTIPSNS